MNNYVKFSRNLVFVDRKIPWLTRNHVESLKQRRGAFAKLNAHIKVTEKEA